MSKALKGSLSIEVQGATYTLHLGINEMCLIEEMESSPNHPVTFQDFVKRIEREEVRATRRLFFVALRRHHPEITVEQAGDLMEELGRMGNLPDVLARMSTTAQPDPKDVEVLGGSRADPRKAATAGRPAGTGTRSTGPRAASS